MTRAIDSIDSSHEKWTTTLYYVIMYFFILTLCLLKIEQKEIFYAVVSRSSIQMTFPDACRENKTFLGLNIVKSWNERKFLFQF